MTQIARMGRSKRAGWPLLSSLVSGSNYITDEVLRSPSQHPCPACAAQPGEPCYQGYTYRFHTERIGVTVEAASF